MGDYILCLHHNDRDGYMATGCVLLKHTDIPVYTKAVDYKEPLSEAYMEDQYEKADLIYLVDYSISTEANIEFAYKYRDKIVWIDHHASSLRTLEKEPELRHLAGYRCVGLSGALLAWVWYKADKLPMYLTYYIHMHDELVGDDEIIKALNPPTIILYTHLYDTWHIDDRVVNFNFGNFNFDDPIRCAYAIEHVTTKDFEGIIEDGKLIREYVINENWGIIKEYGTEIRIMYRDKEYTCIAVNMHRPNSLKFSDYADCYDILMPFYWNGTGFTYSLYKGTCSDNTKDLDLSKIAELFGGGGHPNAAGFTISNPADYILPKKGQVITVGNTKKEVLSDRDSE